MVGVCILFISVLFETEKMRSAQMVLVHEGCELAFLECKSECVFLAIDTM